MGYVTGRDDEWLVTAGSDEKAVGARTDEIEDHVETPGPSPHPMPPHAREPHTEGGDPGFRVRGPAGERRRGGVDETEPPPPVGVGAAAPTDTEGTEAGPVEPFDAGSEDVAGQTGGGHVGADVDWVPSDEDDPDAGSGRTEDDDGGYLPGEGTGRPYRR